MDKSYNKIILQNKGPRLEMTNRRGIFLTNLVSKIFENLIMQKTSNTVKIPPCQNGGQKGRSAIDNIIVIMAIMDNNRRLKQKTYIIYADAEKCFDKLWLKDCLVDIYQLGLRAKETAILFEMKQK